MPPRDRWLWYIDEDRHRHALRLRFTSDGRAEVTSWPALLWDRGQWPAPAEYESSDGKAWTWASIAPGGERLADVL